MAENTEPTVNNETRPRRKRSNLPLLGALFLLLAAVAVLLVDPFGWLTPGQDELDASDPGRRVLIKADAEDIEALEIDPATGEAFRLEREDGEWYVERANVRYRADADRVSLLLDDLEGLRSETLVTDKDTEYETLEVSDEKAIVLSVFTGNPSPLARLHVGKPAPGFKAGFVRIDGGQQVYRSNANLRTHVAYSLEEYRSKKPWTFDQLDATVATIRPPEGQTGEPLELTRTEAVWTYSGGNANQNVVTELLTKLTELDANQFVDEPDAAVTGLQDAQPAITVATARRTYSLTIGAKEDSNRYVSDHDGMVYKVPEYRLDFYRELDFSRLTFDEDAANAEADAETDEAADNVADHDVDSTE